MSETPVPDAAVQAMLLNEARRCDALQRRALTLRAELDAARARVAELEKFAKAVRASGAEDEHVAAATVVARVTFALAGLDAATAAKGTSEEKGS